MDSTFFSWETLGTVAGATAAITIVLAILEQLIGVVDSRIRNAIVTLVSIALLEAVVFSAGDGTWETYVLAAINGLVVALAVLRLNDTTVSRLISRSKGEPISYAKE